MRNKKIVSELNSPRGSNEFSRRKAVKTIASTVLGLAAYHTLPVNWSKPIVQFGVLPAHAQTSQIPSAVIESVTFNDFSPAIQIIPTITFNIIADFTIVTNNITTPGSITRYFTPTTVPTTLSPNVNLLGSAGDLIKIDITNNVNSETITKNTTVVF